MPNPKQINKPNAVEAQEIHRNTIEQERQGRNQWRQKYGQEFIEKFHESQQAGEKARATMNLPSAFMKDTNKIDLPNLPEVFKRTKDTQLSSDEVGLWNQYELEKGLFEKDHHIKSVNWMDV